MEEWQGCLSPLCQRALVQAREDVRARYGYAITVEDFLLALLLGEAAIRTFLRRQGVDLDELIRTVQCEQPIVTAIGAEGDLSSQLQYWVSQTLEVTGLHWVEWPDLLSTLTHGADRLASKAYVAVLEQVRHWHCQADAELPEQGASAKQPPPASATVTIDVKEQASLADDLAVHLASEPNALVWLKGPSGSGKTALLRHQIPQWPLPSLWLDLRAECQIMASDALALPATDRTDEPIPALVLDDTSPEDLLALISDPGHIASTLIASYKGPLLLVSDQGRCIEGNSDQVGGLLPGSEQDSSILAAQLSAYTGRRLYSVSMPASCFRSRLAILRIHQPVIERKWRVEITENALLAAAASNRSAEKTPGDSIRLLEAAAARTALLAERGDLLTRELNARIADLRRRLLVCHSRGDATGFLEQRLGELKLEHAANEGVWLEREASGLLRRVSRDHVCQEIRRGARANQPAQVRQGMALDIKADGPHIAG